MHQTKASLHGAVNEALFLFSRLIRDSELICVSFMLKFITDIYLYVCLSMRNIQGLPGPLKKVCICFSFHRFIEIFKSAFGFLVSLDNQPDVLVASNSSWFPKLLKLLSR